MRKSIVLTALAALAGCNAGSQNNQSAAGRADHPEWLVGRWATEYNAAACDDRRPEIELLADGDAEFEGRSGNWRVEGDRLVTSQTADEAEIITKTRFRRDGDRIRFLGGERMIWVRCGTRVAREAARARADELNYVVPVYNYIEDSNGVTPMDNTATNAM